MNIKQRRPSASNLHHNPSTSFSTISSSASATSVGTSRSGGSRLLFGEIDTTSDRSFESVASVCSLVLSDSSTFLKFWLTDRCREQLVSSLRKRDLANLRLVCHDFSARLASTLFHDLSITFRSNTFTRPARLAALDRFGHHVKHLAFKFAHAAETLLPPLIHTETGEELDFTYRPQTDPGSNHAKYDDEEITQLLIHQYPPLFHAATNVPAFIRGMSCFINLTHLEIKCPGSEQRPNHSRRSTVDFALISVRIAVERNCYPALDTLTLAPVHAAGLLALSPLAGSGASPATTRRWSCIRHLSIATPNLPPTQAHPSNRPTKDPHKLLTAYLSAFQPNLLTLRFAWLGPTKGPLPLRIHHTNPPAPAMTTPPQETHHHHHHHQSARHHHHHRQKKPREQHNRNKTQLFFPHLSTLHLSNATAKASHLRQLAVQHAATLQSLELTDVELEEGSWEEAFAPLVDPPRPCLSTTPSPRLSPHDRAASVEPEGEEMADIPIMFTPPGSTPPRPPARSSPAQLSSCPRPQGTHPSARSQTQTQAQTQTQTQVQSQAPERERKPNQPGSLHGHRQRTATKHPCPPPALSIASEGPLPKRMKRAETPIQPRRKGGILGRVARGVRKTFGGQ